MMYSIAILLLFFPIVMAALHHLLIGTFLLISISCFCICQSIQVNTTDSQLWLNNPNATGILQSTDFQNLVFSPLVPDFATSSNTSFSLGFLNSTTPGLFTLGLFMHNLSMVIWEANRGDPVGVNANLTLTTDGDLVLRDSDGRFVWSTQTARKNVTAVEVQGNGNLVVLAGETVLWESFDHPTDTLVVNQTFKHGMKLQSSSEFYTLVMEPGGLVLYSNFSGTQEPYWIRGYVAGQDSLVSAKTRVCGSSVSAVLDGLGTGLTLNMTLDTAGVNCSTIGTQSWQLNGQNMTVRNQSLIRLESDGNLKAYSLDATGQREVSFELFNRSSTCMLPQKCQTFGLCSNGECDSCLSSDGALTGAWSENCSLPAVESCGDIQSLDFFPVRGAEYFSSKYLNSSSGQHTFEGCRKQCLSNCSCLAFFFWEDSSSCFMTSSINTLQKVAEQSHVCYVKTSKGPGSGLASGATAGIVVGCLVFALVLILVPVLLCMRRRKQRFAVDYESDDLGAAQNPGPVRYSYAELEQMTENFSKELGDGGVYQGVCADGKKVVVKNVERVNISKRKFLAQVSLLGRIHHWNLVKLVGFCSEGYSRLVVYEYLEHGSLDKWIYRDRDDFLEWELRMGILLGVARALAYLHDECMERIVHLDVNPQNILLDPSFVAKVAELGQFSKSGEFDVGYGAPEVLSGGLVTDKSDVYSFGVVMLEVVSGLRCFDAKKKFYLPEFAMEMVGRGRSGEVVDPRMRDVDEFKAGSAFSIAFQCVQEDASMRPSMRRVVQMLEGSSEISETPSQVWKMPWN